MNTARKLMPLVFLLISSVGAAPGVPRFEIEDSYHNDFRKTPKIIFNAGFKFRGLTPEALAQEYIRVSAGLFQIKAEDLVLKSVRASLLGTHYHYQQVLEGKDVAGAELIVSVNAEANEVYQAFNNTFPITSADRKSAFGQKHRMSEEQAYDAAWNDLKVHGPLIETPKAQLMYLAGASGFRAVYEVQLSVQAPFGYWRVVVDAVTGEILTREDRRLTRKFEKPVDIDSYQGLIWSRKPQFAQFFSAESKKLSAKGLQAANGSGLVFDPDPRTSLKDAAIKDASPATAFDAAYFQRELTEISFDGTNYSLVGPWVQIKDFESPATVPSKTANGQWTAKRGSNAFNDAMTYYHIDKNQRYMQSLGFTGNKAIQGRSVEIDSDGVNGDDNSHFIPSSNRIAFGHGCVDDNEDADVILHEYGHAIHYSINSNWSGGDTGAMGEGFGDYWAGSYSISTANGLAFGKNDVFNWDGQSADCWPGRKMNRLDVVYNHTRTYPPHSPIENGAQSDELWSTPLFQALLTLQERGFARENVDRIVLEAHFGLGSGLKMRDMASAIVQTANRLHAGEAYAQVFLQKFVHHNIIEMPKAAFTLARVEVQDSGGNGQADPGETVAMKVVVENKGTNGANGVSGVLTTTSNQVEIIQGQAAFANAPIGGSSENQTALTVKLGSGFECGSTAQFGLKLSFDGGASSEQQIPLSLSTGKARSAKNTVDLGAGLAIPDNNATGVTSSMTLSSSETVKSAKVTLNIAHPFIGDVKATLTAPSGKSVILHNRTGGSAANIRGTYPTELTPAEDLAKLAGDAVNGEWKLVVSDGASRDEGKVLGWSLDIVSGYDCN